MTLSHRAFSPASVFGGNSSNEMAHRDVAKCDARLIGLPVKNGLREKASIKLGLDAVAAGTLPSRETGFLDGRFTGNRYRAATLFRDISPKSAVLHRAIILAMPRH